MSFAKNIGRNISKNVSSKYSQKLLDHAKQSATDAIKTSPKRVIQKTTEATSDLIGNKIADKITRVSKTSPQNNLHKNEETLREKYGDAYSKTSGNLWQYHCEEPALDNNGNIIGFHADNKNSTSFKFKQQTTRKTGNGGTNDVEIMVTFKYLRIFENA